MKSNKKRNRKQKFYKKSKCNKKLMKIYKFICKKDKKKQMNLI